MMLPIAAAGMGVKRAVVPLVMRFGYRGVLVGNTLLVGTMIASFMLISRAEPLWLRLIHLGIFGGLNSLQFSVMNTLTLKDLSHEGASSGNSLFSAVQMLSMSLGVTVAGALLTTFQETLGQNDSSRILLTFHATFLCVGLMTCASAWIFWQLSTDVKQSGAQTP
jgi:hypothetical protein